tara:strand:+ start:125 stop:445 length:321 start_codon:yes stop_codon:yes gene_type:complete
MSLKWPNKDPDDVLDYSIDWSRFIGTDTLSSVSWSIIDENDIEQSWTALNVINGLQLVSETFNDTVATIQLGLGTNNKVYDIFCEVTLTPSNSTAKRKIRIRTQQQ